ncbi:MAG: sugar phosphate nucleotidyltransferase [Patescibacteria group bacterium]
MKGVILAGGKGTRLYPLTRVTNKHLLPIYDKPVIYYGIEKLVSAGVDHIMIVCPPDYLDSYVRLLGSGENFISKGTGKQVQIVYGIQNQASGIAYGLYIAKDYVGYDNCILYLGDNLLEDDISEHVRNFSHGATVFLKKVKNPDQFGIAVVDDNNVVKEIVEKPKKNIGDLAVVGVYIYDNSVFEKMVGQEASKRGEKEITDINNAYIQEGTLRAVTLKKSWFDIGSIDALVEASVYYQKKKNNGK